MICDECKYCDNFHVSEVGCFGSDKPCDYFHSDDYIENWPDKVKYKYNGWLFRWARHFWCGMIYGHEWKNTSPMLDGWVCQECIKCGKERCV